MFIPKSGDFVYYYLYPVSDTFTLLAAIIGLIATDIQDFGGHLMHAILTLISIALNTTQIFSSFDGNSWSQIYDYLTDMFDNEATGLPYTLVSSIVWNFLVLYQAIYNCKHEHTNQKRRKQLRYQSINKHHSFSMRPIEVNQKVKPKTSKSVTLNELRAKSQKRSDQKSRKTPSRGQWRCLLHHQVKRLNGHVAY